MSYASPYSEFVFEDYEFDEDTGLLAFHYSFDGAVTFTEYVHFEPSKAYDRRVFEKVVFLAFVLAGISYYKTYPTKSVRFANHELTQAQAQFFSETYRNGLSQFIFENELSPDNIAIFEPTTSASDTPFDYEGSGVLVLQSGGKDSLLLATLLQAHRMTFTAWYMSQSASHPAILDAIPSRLLAPVRDIDTATLAVARQDNALNGHVPITFINLAYGLVDAVLHGHDTVLAAIGREGEEPYDHIGDFAIRHQWSKTWHAEQLLSGYVRHVISPSLTIGSPLRGFSELKIAELFVEHCWQSYGRDFSSCNRANYTQGHDNAVLRWCGECPKCANSYLLFAPFVERVELNRLFGKDLFLDGALVPTFKGLLEIDNTTKPFECVGEVAELRSAYWLSQSNGYSPLPFSVPISDFDKDLVTPMQPWASAILA